MKKKTAPKKTPKKVTKSTSSIEQIEKIKQATIIIMVFWFILLTIMIIGAML